MDSAQFDPVCNSIRADTPSCWHYRGMANADAAGIYDSDNVAELRDALETVIDSFPDYYFVFRAVHSDGQLTDFRLELANQAVCEALGCSIEDIRGESAEYLFPFTDKLAPLGSRLSEAAARQFPADFDLGDSPFEKDGATPVRLRARCIPDGDRLYLSVTRVSAPSGTNSAANLPRSDFDKWLKASPFGIAVVILNSGLIELTNKPFDRILGSDSAAVRGRFLEDFLSDADRRVYRGAVMRLRGAEGHSQQLSLRVNQARGKTRHVQVVMSTFPNGRAVVQMLDRTREAEVLEMAEERGRDFELLAESMSDVVLRLDSAGTVEWCSPSGMKFFDRSSGEIVGHHILTFIHRDFAGAARTALTAAASGQTKKDFLLRILRRDGDSTWAQGLARPIMTPRGGIVGVVLALRDVNAEQAARAKFEELSLRDPLTGLGTRAGLIARLPEELSDPNPRVAVLKFHYDRLGRLNDAITFAGADQVITEIGDRLHSHIGARGDAYRIGPADFAILLRETDTISQALLMAERLRTLCAQPISVGDFRVIPSLSIGVAVARNADANRLLYDANRAMRTAKLRGGNQCALADDRGGLEETRWLVDEAELNDALREGRYNAFYQPIVTLPDEHLAGFEVLVRCRHPDGRATLPPGQMAVAEATGLIKEIDRLVMREALFFLRGLDDRLFLSVNVSVRSLADPSYLQWVEQSVANAGVAPSRVRLEVTESTALAVPPSVRLAMERLSGKGFTWYMDDFGTGYSSLASLRDLPMGGLKLDRTFTAALAENRDKVRNLTKGLARLADDMGLVTVAEGVETREEADILAAQGWRFGQGWLYGRAMSASDAGKLASSGTASADSDPTRTIHDFSPASTSLDN